MPATYGLTGRFYPIARHEVGVGSVLDILWMCQRVLTMVTDGLRIGYINRLFRRGHWGRKSNRCLAPLQQTPTLAPRSEAWAQNLEHGATPMEIDRSKLSQCLAKAIAYQQVDKPEAAEEWARQLILELHLANILK